MSSSKPSSESQSKPDLVTALSSLAVSVFRERSDPDYVREMDEWTGLLGTADPVLRDLQREQTVLSHRHPALGRVVDQIFSAPELAQFVSKEGELDPLLLHAGGGSRVSAISLITGLLSSAFLQAYCLRLPRDESTYARTVLAGFEELRRAAIGEQVRAHLILGIAGVSLSEGRQVSTPWGVMRPAPPSRFGGRFRFGLRTETSCLLVEPRLVSVKFDRAESPQASFDASEVAADRSYILFPLACSLASSDTMNPSAPLITWQTLLLPFQPASSYSLPPLPSHWKPPVDITERITVLEEWSRAIDVAHTSSVEVAARRLVSASAQRTDRADALIDAVIVWENIVGTTQETTFRVTASLAKALEPDRTKRRAMRKALGDVYAVRSRVVHGAAVDQSAIHDAATKAIDVAVRILAFSYKRGREWLSLSSTERADSLLLEEP
jgi:hypothetical protein